MKKTLIALAALGVVGAASAQVAISGSIGAGVQNVMGDAKAKFHVTDADIIFSGSEDLGGGLSVMATTGISMENLWNGGGADKTTTGSTRTGVSNVNTILSIGGGFGKLSFSNVLSGAAKMGGPSAEHDITDVIGGYSTLNVFAYTTPEIFPGFTAAAEWAGADSADLAASGTPQLVGNYKNGGLGVYVDNGGATNVWDLRVTYDAGVAKVGVRQDKDKFQEVAITVPMGAMTYGIYTAKGKGGEDAAGLSAAYAMSKQTSVTFGYVSSKKSVSTVNSGNGGNNYRLNLVKKF
jgi:hypothetical protein